MAGLGFSTIRELGRALSTPEEAKSQTKKAIVREVTPDGVVVEIGGLGVLTPVESSTATYSVGDVVQVTNRGGRLTIGGNTTDPSAGTARVVMVEQKADNAADDAARAHAAADAAESDAQRANAAAEEAAGAASEAQASADQANTYALGALAGLSTLESVVDTVQWFADHRTASTDTTVQQDKDYYTYDPSTGTMSKVEPEGTENPSALGWYELDSTIQNYVVSHVAETPEGLYVLSLSNGWRVLVSSGAVPAYPAGVHIVDPQGVIRQSTTAAGVDFSAGKQWHVGSNDAYILYTPASGDDPATITIGGANVILGDNRTLSELVAQVDGTLVFEVSESYSGDTATLTAHVYRGGDDIASSYDDSCFAWYSKTETASPLVPLPSPYTNGRVVQVRREDVGFGAAIVCRFTEPNDAGLLTEDDDSLTDSDGTPYAVRTPSGDYVRVSDLTVETTVFDTDKVMLVGAEDEHLVSIATLKDTFGDGDYERLDNKPSIEGVTLSGNKDFPNLGIFRTDSQGYSVPDEYTLTTIDINALWANAAPIGA